MKEKNKVVCVWCREPLRFEIGKGWIHQNGSLYTMRCRDCGYVGISSVLCPRCNSKNYVDDHCALPLRS